MSRRLPVPTGNSRIMMAALLLCLALGVFLLLRLGGGGLEAACASDGERISGHFDGNRFFNPGPREEPLKRRAWWVLRFIFGKDWSTWQHRGDETPGSPPAERVPQGSMVVTAVGHGTFLIQMDGLNILTDPIWSERCSPVSWAGPKRYRAPGIRFEDLPPIDAVLVSHNHYDHLDVTTLERLASREAGRSGVNRRAGRAITTLGNRSLIRDTGMPQVDELDWWQSVPLSGDVKVTVVPAQHFSGRRPWDRNRTLWGGFVISGPSGNVYYSGDTGYGPHFREIARRFSPIRAALLPISPFRPPNSKSDSSRRFPEIHMGPAGAVQAHLDLAAKLSIAAHFQVFQLGADGFEDAPRELRALVERELGPGAFITPVPGKPIHIAPERQGI